MVFGLYNNILGFSLKKVLVLVKRKLNLSLTDTVNQAFRSVYAIFMSCQTLSVVTSPLFGTNNEFDA